MSSSRQALLSLCTQNATALQIVFLSRRFVKIHHHLHGLRTSLGLLREQFRTRLAFLGPQDGKCDLTTQRIPDSTIEISNFARNKVGQLSPEYVEKFFFIFLILLHYQCQIDVYELLLLNEIPFYDCGLSIFVGSIGSSAIDWTAAPGVGATGAGPGVP